MSLSSYLTTNDITVQEINNKNNIYDFNGGKNYILNGIIVDDIKYNFHPFDYNITYPSSKYLLITFIPKYNISYFKIRVDLRGQIYNLSESYTIHSLHINSLLNNAGPYYFIINSDKEYKSVNITFKTNKYINYLEYDELADKFSSFKFGKIIRPINTNSSYNEMISSFLLYSSSLSKNNNNIIFKLEHSNFSYILVHYDFYYAYNKNIYFGNKGNSFYLFKGNEYNFKAYSSSRNISIEIALSNIYDLPFSYLMIKEYDSKNDYVASTTKYLFTKVKNGKLILTFNHYLYYGSSYLLIHVIPNENVPNFDIKLNYNNYYPSSNNDNTKMNIYSNHKKIKKPLIIAMIAVPILIVIIIIIIFCYKCKKNSNHLKLDNIKQNNEVYSVNDSLKNNEVEQPYYNNQKEDFQSYREFNDYSYNKNQNDLYMFPYDQEYGGQNRNAQQYINPPNNNQNLGNFSIY